MKIIIDNLEYERTSNPDVFWRDGKLWLWNWTTMEIKPFPYTLTERVD